MAETFWPPRKLTVADNAAYVGAQGEPVLVLGDDGLVDGMALHDGITLGGMTMPTIDPATGALVNPVTGNTPAAGDVFHVFGGLGRIRVQNTGDVSETFTLTYYLRDGSTDTATETLAAGYDEDWPINALGLDHLTWASTGTGASVETY